MLPVNIAFTVLLLLNILHVLLVASFYVPTHSQLAPVYSDSENIVIPKKSIQYLDYSNRRMFPDAPQMMRPVQPFPAPMEPGETKSYMDFLNGFCTELDVVVDAMKESLTEHAPYPGHIPPDNSGVMVLSQYETPDRPGPGPGPGQPLQPYAGPHTPPTPNYCMP